MCTVGTLSLRQKNLWLYVLFSLTCTRMKIFSLGVHLFSCSRRSSARHFMVSFNGYGDQDQYTWMLVTIVHACCVSDVALLQEGSTHQLLTCIQSSSVLLKLVCATHFTMIGYSFFLCLWYVFWLRPLGRPRRRWEDNIKTDLQEVGGGGGDWMELAQDRDRLRALVNTVMNFQVR